MIWHQLAIDKMITIVIDSHTGYNCIGRNREKASVWTVSMACWLMLRGRGCNCRNKLKEDVLPLAPTLLLESELSLVLRVVSRQDAMRERLSSCVEHDQW